MSTPSPAEYETRIRALERMNATLAGEVDRLNQIARQPIEDYYTLAEIRLIADAAILDYGSYGQRLHSIADLIDRKRPELKPRG